MPTHSPNITATVDHVRTAELRWSQLPASVRADLDSIADILVTSGSPAEVTTESYDAIVNEWLAPHGLAQRTTFAVDPTVARPIFTTEVTTTEALAELTNPHRT